MQGLTLAPRLAGTRLLVASLQSGDPHEIDASGKLFDLIIQANMRDLARYAPFAGGGPVPIVEPDISLKETMT